jgi:hypothetical protein
MNFKSLIIPVSILGVIGLTIGSIVSAGNTVTATVTPGNYSVSVSPASANYSGMTLSETKSSATITATSDGSLAAKINIIGADATYTTYTWTQSTTAPGTDTFVHAFSTKATAPASGATLGSDPTVEWVALDKGATYKTLVASLASAGTQDFKLDMRTPTTAGAETSFGNQYSTSVTLQAVAP